MNRQKYLRPLKRKCYDYIYDHIEDRTGKIGVKILTDSTIVPRGQIVGIKEIADSHTVIDDIDYCCDIIPTDRECKPETVLYAGYYRHQWGHFLFNSTARLWWLIQDMQRLSEIDKIVFIAADNEPALIDGNYKEFFKLLGILDKIHIINSPEAYKTIIVPDLAFEHDVFFSKEMLSIFDFVRSSALISNKTKTYKKIFISRSGLKNAEKNEVNIKCLDNLFSKNGFEIIHPERLKLGELIVLLENAEGIISVSGSTSHNLIFANEKSNKFILERSAQNNVFQINISKMAGQQILHIDSFLTPTLLIPTGKVFFYYFTEAFNRFIEEQGFEAPSEKEISKLSSARRVYQFLSAYKKECGYLLGLNEDFNELESIEEAYNDSVEVLGFCLKSTPLKYYLRQLFRFLEIDKKI